MLSTVEWDWYKNIAKHKEKPLIFIFITFDRIQTDIKQFSINEPNSFTPLHVASSTDRLAISTNILIKTGNAEVEADAKNFEKGKSPLRIVEEKDVEGNTPLHIAATNGCTKNLILLLFKGNADVKVENSKGIQNGLLSNCYLWH